MFEKESGLKEKLAKDKFSVFPVNDDVDLYFKSLKLF